MSKNSMATLPRCVNACLGQVNEIVIFDDNSNDDTESYIHGLNNAEIRFIKHPLRTFAEQRKLMCDAATSEWVLIIDADEYAMDGLFTEIYARITQTAHVAFRVPQKNYLPKMWRAVGQSAAFYYTYQKRLFKKNSVSFKLNQWVHVPLQHQGRAPRLRYGLNHHSFDSLRHMVRKQIAYGESSARHLYEYNKQVSLLQLWLRMYIAFFKFYVLKSLWRFGMAGFMTAYALSFHVFYKYAYLYEMNHQNLNETHQERADIPGAAKV